MAASTYDGSARPVCEGGGPTVVETQFRLLHMNGINQKLGIIILGGYLRTWWNDHRLRFNGTSASGCFDKINLAGEDIRLGHGAAPSNESQTYEGSPQIAQNEVSGSVAGAGQRLV